MDTNVFSVLANALQQILPYLPAHAAADIYAAVSFVVATAIFIRYVWSRWFKPPAEGTKAALLYNLLTTLAAMRGFNAPAYGPGYKSIKVPVGTDKANAIAVLNKALTPSSPEAFAKDAPEEGASVPGKS